MLVLRCNRVSRLWIVRFRFPIATNCTLVRIGVRVLGGTDDAVPADPSRDGGMVESQEDPDMSDSVSDCGDCTGDRTAVTEPEVEALVKGICFKTGPPRRLGVEVEWLVHE